MESENIVEVENLSVLMKDRFLVQDVSFCVKKGSCLGIVGEDQSGKTSLIKAISGALPISDGIVRFDGKNLKDGTKLVNQISLCLDPPMFFKYQSVFENIRYLCSLSDKADKDLILSTLAKFGLEKKARKKVKSLSYYEKKLMALTLAFIIQPKLMILDEPFKSLPYSNVKKIVSYLDELKENGTTIIVTSRQYDQIEGLCDEYLFMQERKLVEILSQEECDKKSTVKAHAFIKVKYPHYCGKLLIENFNFKVKILGKKVVFEADEELTAKAVKFLTKAKIAIYSAGYMTTKSEKIFISLAPFFKEEI